MLKNLKLMSFPVLSLKETQNITLMPKTKISYLRNYYNCEIGRITIDTEVNCQRIHSLKNAFKNDNPPKLKF